MISQSMIADPGVFDKDPSFEQKNRYGTDQIKSIPICISKNMK